MCCFCWKYGHRLNCHLMTSSFVDNRKLSVKSKVTGRSKCDNRANRKNPILLISSISHVRCAMWVERNDVRFHSYFICVENRTIVEQVTFTVRQIDCVDDNSDIGSIRQHRVQSNWTKPIAIALPTENRTWLECCPRVMLYYRFAIHFIFIGFRIQWENQVDLFYFSYSRRLTGNAFFLFYFSWSSGSHCILDALVSFLRSFKWTLINERNQINF